MVSVVEPVPLNAAIDTSASIVNIASESMVKKQIPTEGVREFEERIKKLMGEGESDYEEQFESEGEEEPEQTLQPHANRWLLRDGQKAA